MNRELIKQAAPGELAGMCLAIYGAQTADEQRSGGTYYQNGVGFTGADGGFGSSIARQINEKGSLTEKQVAALRRMMPKYWRQLAGEPQDHAHGLTVGAGRSGRPSVEAQRVCYCHRNDLPTDEQIDSMEANLMEVTF